MNGFSTLVYYKGLKTVVCRLHNVCKYSRWDLTSDQRECLAMVIRDKVAGSHIHILYTTYREENTHYIYYGKI